MKIYVSNRWEQVYHVAALKTGVEYYFARKMGDEIVLKSTFGREVPFIGKNDFECSVFGD